MASRHDNVKLWLSWTYCFHFYSFYLLLCSTDRMVRKMPSWSQRYEVLAIKLWSRFPQHLMNERSLFLHLLFKTNFQELKVLHRSRCFEIIIEGLSPSVFSAEHDDDLTVMELYMNLRSMINTTSYFIVFTINCYLVIMNLMFCTFCGMPPLQRILNWLVFELWILYSQCSGLLYSSSGTESYSTNRRISLRSLSWFYLAAVMIAIFLRLLSYYTLGLLTKLQLLLSPYEMLTYPQCYHIGNRMQLH